MTGDQPVSQGLPGQEAADTEEYTSSCNLTATTLGLCAGGSIFIWGEAAFVLLSCP